MDSHLLVIYCSVASYKSRRENKRSPLSNHFEYDVYTLWCKYKKTINQQFNMTQAAVDKAGGSGAFLKASRKRRYNDDDEDFSVDDPSWEPSDCKPKRKQRCYSSSLKVVETVAQSCLSLHSTGITVKLSETSDQMWENYRRVGTEMIICKEGRRMFPYIEVSIQGLQKDNLYSVSISVQRKDQSRYRYNSSRGWHVISRDSKAIPERKVQHGDSKNTGSHFMKKPISFKTVKMTNNFSTTREDQLILVSMRKYYPMITIFCHNTEEETTHPLTDCDFMAVTSYQNDEVTQLKIDTNQFAAAFRKKNNKTPPEETAGESCTDVKPMQQSTNEQVSNTNTAPQHLIQSNGQEKKQNRRVIKKKSRPRFETKEDDTRHSTTEVPSGSSTTDAEVSTAPVHPPPSDCSSDEEDDMCLNDAHEFVDLPQHIRPVYVKTLHQCPLSNIKCSLRSLYHPCPRPSLPPPSLTHISNEDGLDQEMMWSSAFHQTNNISSEGNSDDCEGVDLGLFLSEL